MTGPTRRARPRRVVALSLALALTAPALSAQEQSASPDGAAPSADPAERGRTERTDRAASDGAASAEAERSAAREHFRAGVEFSRQGRHDLAKEQFSASARLHPHAATHYNLALSELALGRRVAAHRQLLVVLERARLEPGELSSVNLVGANERLRALQAELVQVEVEVPEGGASLSFNGLALALVSIAGVTELSVAEPPMAGAALVPMGRARLVLEPGSGKLGAEVGGARQEYVLDEAPGARRAFDLSSVPGASSTDPAPPAAGVSEPAGNELDTAKAPRRGPVPRAPGTGHSVRKVTSPSKTGPQAAPEQSASELRLPAYGVAVAGAATAAVFGTLAWLAKRDLDAACPDPGRCPSGSTGRRADVERYALIADVALGVMVLGAGVALYVEVTAPATPTNAGLVWSGAF